MKIGLLFVTVFALAVVSCSSNQSQTSTSESSAAPAESAAAMATSAAGGMMAKMTGHTASFAMKAQNGSGENGKVTLLGTGAKTTVTISLTGENATGKQPAHIHVGPCSKLGAVKYPLSDVVLGKSVTIVSAPMASLTVGTLAVNVHESAANIAKYVSCGDLTKSNMH